MSLVLEIEFLTGVCRAAIEPASDAPDWPPQPDRVFSALVSAWAARGEHREEREALEWLEEQLPPDVHASGHAARTAPSVFVPPNDFQSPGKTLNELKWYRDFLAHGKRPPKENKKAWEQALSTLPETRTRKERQFPVACPDDPVMTLVWPEEPSPELLESLDSVARDVGYLGHSASLVRCRFFRGGSETQPHPGAPRAAEDLPWSSG